MSTDKNPNPDNSAALFTSLLYDFDSEKYLSNQKCAIYSQSRLNQIVRIYLALFYEGGRERGQNLISLRLINLKAVA